MNSEPNHNPTPITMHQVSEGGCMSMTQPTTSLSTAEDEVMVMVSWYSDSHLPSLEMLG